MAKILVVEDEAAIANAYRIVLEQAGHEVTVAADAKTALALMDQVKPALILLDIMMPEMSGLDFLSKLGAPKALGKTKVIALSNIKTADVVVAATKLGVVDYLTKVDFTPHQVVEVVNRQLAGK